MENENSNPSQMPGMPGITSTGNYEGLNPPEHNVEEKPPILDNVDNKVNNKVDIPLVPEKKGIEVVATRAGFYNQHRKEKDDKFIVSKFKKLGEWMKCVDPVIEKKRVEFFIKKKKGE